MTKAARVSTNTVRLRRIAERVARRILRERNDVLAIAIYGSVARGEAGPGSDLDMEVVVRRGPRAHVTTILDGVLISISFFPRSRFERHFIEASASLPQRHGGLRADVLYDPSSLYPKVRTKVARMPVHIYRESAREALTGMYEYIGKFRNARRRRDHANLVYAAWVIGVHALNLVALLNRRAYASENTLWSEWRSFPSLPPRFAECIDVVCGFRRVRDRDLVRATELLWRTCSAWAESQGVRLATTRSVAAIRIPGGKTT